MRRLLLPAAVALLCVAGVTLVFCKYDDSEKPGAAYFLGHWWDLESEIAVPAAVVASILLAVRIVLALREPPAATRGFQALDPHEREDARD